MQGRRLAVAFLQKLSNLHQQQRNVSMDCKKALILKPLFCLPPSAPLGTDGGFKCLKHASCVHNTHAPLHGHTLLDYPTALEYTRGDMTQFC